MSRERVFADHHPFSKSEIEALIAEARRDALTLVTTEKDLARLRGGEGCRSWASDIVPFAVTLEFDDAAQLRKFVSDRLFRARERKFAQLSACQLSLVLFSAPGKCRCSTALGIA